MAIMVIGTASNSTSTTVNTTETNQTFSLVILHIPCCFELSGKNEQKLKLQIRFPQTGLRLNKNRREQKLLIISPELKCSLFCGIGNQISNQKTSYFGSFLLNRELR